MKQRVGDPVGRLVRAKLMQTLLMALFLAFGARVAQGQLEGVLRLRTMGGGGQIPSQDYYLAHGFYIGGDYQRAAREWSNGARTSFKIGTNLFLDNCCYTAMSGECWYHLGDYARAIEQYEFAIRLYMQYCREDWQSVVQLPPIIQADNAAVQRSQVNWYLPTVPMLVGNVPDTMQVMFGRLDAELAFQVGGVVANPEFRSVNVIEILRTIAIALQRRRYLLGQTCQFTPLSSAVVDSLKRQGAAGDSILAKCNLVLYGLGLAGKGDLTKAREILASSLRFGGGMVHPLTAIALLELARISDEQGDPAGALQLAIEASFVGGIFHQHDIVEQAISLGNEIHLRTNRTEWSILRPVITWANRDNARQLQVSATIRLADCLTEANQLERATRALAEAKRAGARSDVLRGPIAGRLRYLEAGNLFASGDFDNGRLALTEALRLYSSGSRWLFQLNLINSLVASGQNITTRQADAMYGVTLNDPGEANWRSDPIEAFSYLASPHLSSIENWLEIAIQNRQYDRAIEIAELLRRHRFFANLPLFGRLFSMRWVIHGPEADLNAAAKAQRADFLNRYQEYADLMRQTIAVRNSLIQLPLQPVAESDNERLQRDLFVQLMQLSAKQETLLASAALKREPANMVFPTQPELSSLRESMNGETSIIYIAATERNHWVFHLSRRGTRFVAGHKNRDMLGMVNRVFRELSLSQRQLAPEELAKDEWREKVLSLSAAFLPELALEDLLGGNLEDELVIIPDGYTWYLPFEVLLFGEEVGSAKMLGSEGVIRYSPTLGLAQIPSRVFRQPVRTGIFPTILNRDQNPDDFAAVVKKLAGRFADSGTWTESLGIPGSLLSSVADEFIVLAPVERPKRGNPFALLPLAKDAGRNNVNLASWLSLPVEGVEWMIMPGFDSDGAYGVDSGTFGNDLFLTSLGLMASGTRGVLLTRWSTYGESAMSLTADFVELNQKMSGARALRKAAQQLQEKKIDYDNEPRVKRPARPVEAKYEHPLFWAGTMVMEIPPVNPPDWLELNAASDFPAKGAVMNFLMPVEFGIDEPPLETKKGGDSNPEKSEEEQSGEDKSGKVISGNEQTEKAGGFEVRQ